MEWLVPAIVAIVLIVFAFIGQKKGWIDLSSKRRSSGGGGPLGAIDEIFQPTRYETQIEADRQSVLPAPAPVPGDGDKDVYKGNVKIHVSVGRVARSSPSTLGQIRVLGMPTQERRHERATRRHPIRRVRPDPVECTRDQRRAESALLDRGIDLGVREAELVLASAVLGEAEHVTVPHEGEPVRLGLVNDLGVQAEARSMTVVGIIDTVCTRWPSISRSSTSAISRPTSIVGCSTVVSGGWALSAK